MWVCVAVACGLKSVFEVSESINAVVVVVVVVMVIVVVVVMVDVALA